MVRFIVKLKKITRLDLETTSLTIGTHTSCELVLNDPVAAQRHCHVRFDNQFLVQDAGTGTGTFVNGLPASEPTPLADGAEIAIGVTRLCASIEEEGPTLTLQLEPGFHFVRGRAGEFQSDRDRWVRTEVGMGRFRPLRWANFAALLAVPVLLGLVFAEDLDEQLLDPGPLSAAHADLFEGNATLSLATASQLLVAEQGCTSCHAPLLGTPMERCDQCHNELMQTQHPFAEKHRDDPDPAKVSATWDEGACNMCHREHRGTEGFLPGSQTLAQSCAECHSGTSLEGSGFAPPPVTAVLFDRAEGYSSFEFGHDDHIAVDCATCHRALTDVALTEAGFRDYAPVPFETCAGCHVADQRDLTLNPEWHPATENTWTVGWHGSEAAPDTCGQCHEEGAVSFGPALSEVTRYRSGSEEYLEHRGRYELSWRSHDEVFEAHAGGQDCSACHRNERTLLARQPVVGVFWHALHVEQGLPFPESTEEQNTLSATCLECHSDRRESDALRAANDGIFQWSNPQACSECHGEPSEPGAADIAPAPQPFPPDLGALSAPLTQPDFPHQFHLDFAPAGSLAQGCFTCHELEVPADLENYMAIPTTRPEARECASCHVRHENVAGNACQVCHPNPEGTYNVFLGASPPADRPLPTRPWPAANGFSHFSLGHLESVERDCRECHQVGTVDGQDLARAADLRGVPIPTEADRVCQDCHLRSRQRFHWRR